MSSDKQTVFIVDDDRSVRTSLSRLLRAAGYETRVFGSATEFLQRPAFSGTGCLVLDVKMPGVSGTVLQKQLNRQGNKLPVVFLTGHGDMPMGVQAIKMGAEDFLQKPVDETILLDVISRAMMHCQSVTDDDMETSRVLSAVESLTPREREILRLILGGATNPQIAVYCEISEKTVKAHRSKVMQKTGASTAAELGWICSISRLTPIKV